MRVGRARLLALWAVICVLAATSLTPTKAFADRPDCSSFKYDLFQRLKPSTGASLLTRSSDEAARAASFGFTLDKGVVAKVGGAADAGLSAVWRLYKPGDFVWASDGADADALEANGYRRQFVEFFAATAALGCLTPVYRLTRQGLHRMATTSDSETLVGAGWTREKVAFFAAPAEDPPIDPDADTTFTIAVIPDTGNETTVSTNSRFRDRATWLADNKKALDLRFAVQVGDLVNWGNAEPAQFTKASAGITPLEAAVPWAAALGNHDTAAVCVGGSACPGANTSKTIRDTTAYNHAFPVSRFRNIGGTFESGRVENAYHIFRAGGVDWLVLSLEIWPRSAVVSWAKSVVASHPRHNVIVLTHDYLTSSGSISTSNGGYGATSPKYLYDQLVRVYPNVKIVLTSHVGRSASRSDVGINGNKIFSMLQHFHSSTNPVRLVEINTASGTVTSRVYSPGTNTTYPEYATSTNGLEFVK